MGTVHGVYLKYVALSAMSYYGYTMVTSSSSGLSSSPLAVLSPSRLLFGPDDDGDEFRMASSSLSSLSSSIVQLLPALILGYSTIINGAIAICFKLERGMGLIGKQRESGQIPWWSYIVYFPFYIPTILYTRIHTKIFRWVDQVEVATEVQPGWWVGGCYYGKDWSAKQQNHKQQRWGGIIDLTVEFPEACRHQTKHYLCKPTWDGIPASPHDLEEAAVFALEARKYGDVLVHCAHGRGRSTTVMCACLVKAGLFATWQEAFEVGIRPKRPVCKLNRRMRQNLTAWQALYVDCKKGN